MSTAISGKSARRPPRGRRERPERRCVKAPGLIRRVGGWRGAPGALDGAKPRGYLGYLKGGAEVGGGGAEPSGPRPVLMSDDPLARMRELFTTRDPLYAKADATVLT